MEIGDQCHEQKQPFPSTARDSVRLDDRYGGPVGAGLGQVVRLGPSDVTPAAGADPFAWLREPEWWHGHARVGRDAVVRADAELAPAFCGGARVSAHHIGAREPDH